MNDKKPKNGDSTSSTLEHHARRRRVLLASLLTGGGAVSGAIIVPQNWAKPIVDSVILPSHAATSCTANLSCSASNVNGGTYNEGNHTVDGFSCDATSIEFDVHSTVDECADPEITLNVSGTLATDSDDGPGSSEILQSGVGLGIDQDSSAGVLFGNDNSADLVLTFSHPNTEDCVISFTFNCTED